MKPNWKILLRECFHSDKERSPIWPYIFISILLHLIISTGLWVFMLKTGDVLAPKEDVVEVFPLLENGDEYKIADIAPPAQEERPQVAKLIGEYDSKVSEESVAISRGEGKRQHQKPNLYAFDKNIFAEGDTPVEEEQKTADKASSSSRGTEDYFPDFKRGAHTYLNVMRFPDVEYFVRMKRIFRTTWNPIPALRHDMMTNRLASGKVEVVMAVSVDKSGNLAELFVLTPSGLPTYDDEALRTIRASSPFAKPPEKFLEKDGMLRMSWTFTQYL